MTIEDNKDIIRQWIEAWLKRDLATLDRLFAHNYTVNDRFIGTEGVKQAVEFFHSALSDLSAELEEIVAEDNRVVIRWTVRGIHIGQFMGQEPTGKPLELKGINIYQVLEGQIVANHEQTNMAEVIQRLKMEN